MRLNRQSTCKFGSICRLPYHPVDFKYLRSFNNSASSRGPDSSLDFPSPQLCISTVKCTTAAPHHVTPPQCLPSRLIVEANEAGSPPPPKKRVVRFNLAKGTFVPSLNGIRLLDPQHNPSRCGTEWCTSDSRPSFPTKRWHAEICPTLLNRASCARGGTWKGREN